MPETDQAEENSGYKRLEVQVKYYNDQAASSKRMFRSLKAATLFFSVSIPIVSGLVAYYPLFGNIKTSVLTGVLGGTIALLEGIQQLNQYHQNWISYRSTAEALKHEKFLYMSKAGPYAKLDNVDAKVLLAERVESLVSQEHSKWTQTQQQAPEDDKDAKQK